MVLGRGDCVEEVAVAENNIGIIVALTPFHGQHGRSYLPELY